MDDLTYPLLRMLEAYAKAARIISAGVVLALAVIVYRWLRVRVLIFFVLSQSLILAYYVLRLFAGQTFSMVTYFVGSALYTSGLTLTILGAIFTMKWWFENITQQHAGGYRRGSAESSA